MQFTIQVLTHVDMFPFIHAENQMFNWEKGELYNTKQFIYGEKSTIGSFITSLFMFTSMWHKDWQQISVWFYL